MYKQKTVFIETAFTKMPPMLVLIHHEIAVSTKVFDRTLMLGLE